MTATTGLCAHTHTRWQLLLCGLSLYSQRIYTYTWLESRAVMYIMVTLYRVYTLQLLRNADSGLHTLCCHAEPDQGESWFDDSMYSAVYKWIMRGCVCRARESFKRIIECSVRIYVWVCSELFWCVKRMHSFEPTSCVFIEGFSLEFSKL